MEEGNEGLESLVMVIVKIVNLYVVERKVMKFLCIGICLLLLTCGSSSIKIIVDDIQDIKAMHYKILDVDSLKNGMLEVKVAK